MKKFTFVTVALLAAITIVQSDTTDEIIKTAPVHLRAYMRQHKEVIDKSLERLEKLCPGSREKVKDVFVTLRECNERADDSLTLCESVQAYTLNCTKPLLKLVDDCLPAKDKGLPTLGVESLVSVVGFFCKQTGETLLELANPCLMKELTRMTPELAPCEDKAKAIEKKYREMNHFPNATQACSTLESMRGCVRARVDVTCKNQKTRNAAVGLYDALLVPCGHLNEA